MADNRQQQLILQKLQDKLLAALEEDDLQTILILSQAIEHTTNAMRTLNPQRSK